MKVCLVVLSVLVVGMAVYIFTKAEKPEDNTPIQFQCQAIDNNHYVSDNELVLLRDKTIKAMIDWSRELTGQERHTEIFTAPIVVVKGYIHEGIPFSKQEERIEREIATYDKEHPYSDYLAYQDCNIKDILSRNHNLFQVGMSMDAAHEIRVIIKALIPTEDMVNGTIPDYYAVEYQYTYSLDLVTNEDCSYKKRELEVWNLKEELDWFYLSKTYERNKNGSKNFLKNFNWRITSILPNYRLHRFQFNDTELPQTIDELFNFTSPFYLDQLIKLKNKLQHHPNAKTLMGRLRKNLVGLVIGILSPRN